MVRTNRLYAAWLGLEAFNHTRDAIGAIGPARQLFFAWVTAGRPSYYEPLVTAPANVRETMTPLRALASACTPEEIAEFVELATAAP